MGTTEEEQEASRCKLTEREREREMLNSKVIIGYCLCMFIIEAGDKGQQSHRRQHQHGCSKSV